MSSRGYNKKKYGDFLSGRISPFSGIYDAVSEQVLLLVFKARQLNEDEVYRQWFAEQHSILNKLLAQSDKINNILKCGRLSYLNKEKIPDDLYDIFEFMCPLYEGFDEGNVSWKTWGKMNSYYIKANDRFKQGEKKTEFIQNELFTILTESKAHCSPIPAHVRKGYSHHDLSIAHSCSDILLTKLDDYYKIDTLYTVAETIYRIIDELCSRNIELPSWLSQFDEIYHGISYGEVRQNDKFLNIVTLLKEIGQEQFIDGVIAECTEHDAERIFNLYVGIYASEIYQWIYNIFRYLKTPQSTHYRWKFMTSEVLIKDEVNLRDSIEWGSDYCQISISRSDLLALIQTHTLYDAALSLADCLLDVYQEPAKQGLIDKDDEPSLTDRERKVHISNDWSFLSSNWRSRENSISIIQLFERWYEKNKVLLISAKKKRTEKASVVMRLAGLRCYDLKMGIPEGNKIKIKDGVYDRVKKDMGLHFSFDISNISLQRYHSKVKSIITIEIDQLIEEQQNKNIQFPYSGETYMIKPLWGKCIGN